MPGKTELSRITIDISEKSHKRLKALAAILGKSMREIVVESIEERLSAAPVPNKETCAALRDAQQRKGLLEAKDAEDFFRKLGI
jgi:ribosomal 50S subunit-associated protein YjgA (DUF615 family)